MTQQTSSSKSAPTRSLPSAPDCAAPSLSLDHPSSEGNLPSQDPRPVLNRCLNGG